VARKGMVIDQGTTGLDLYALTDPVAAREAAAKIGVKMEEGLSWGQIVEAIFGERVEDKLIQPAHVVDLPKEVSPLSKAWPDRPHVAQRFESYVNGWELANAFSELNDPREQKLVSLSRPSKSAAPMTRHIRLMTISSRLWLSACRRWAAWAWALTASPC
jgi:lysyl-tRNA synthetase class II